MAAIDIDDCWDLQFDVIYREHLGRVRSLIRRRVPDRTKHDDLVQETFFRLHRHRHRLDGDRDAWPLLRTIAANLCVDDARRHARHREDALAEVDLSDHAADPARHLDAAFERETIRRALGELPARELRLLVAHEVQGMPYRAIADHESLTLDAVKSAMKRARAGFRAAYTRLGEGVAALVPFGLVGRARRRAGDAVTNPVWRMLSSVDVANIVGVGAVLFGAALLSPHGAAATPTDIAAALRSSSSPTAGAVAARADAEHGPAVGDRSDGPVADPGALPLDAGADIGSDGEWMSVNAFVEGVVPVAGDTGVAPEVKTTCGNEIRQIVCGAVATADDEGDEG